MPRLMLSMAHHAAKALVSAGYDDEADSSKTIRNLKNHVNPL
jgi:hypothetical protein